MNNNKLIFIHIPKTGGSTLQGIINRQYKATEIINVKNSRVADEFMKLPSSTKEKATVLKGHMAFGYHEAFVNPNQVSYITMLREPISRIISNYYFILKQKNHHTHKALIENNYSLKDYVSSGVIANTENAQVRLLSNNIYAPHGTCTPDMLAQAKENLAQKFSVIGINEYFDESILLMQRNLNWKSPFYSRANITGHGVKANDLDAETLKIITDYNALDIELYNWAKEKLLHQIIAEGSSFETRLHRFKKINHWVQKAVNIKNMVFSFNKPSIN